ncbi:MAG: PP2C family protein-serine/threonine phosphatase [Bacteroidetes bacterium]|nr:PP2C family protein-serine/threonine phosphatase [Bacteroidota bacterium]
MSKESIFKRVIDFYSGDLKSDDIEKLIMKDTPERYKYFVRSMDKPAAESKNTFTTFTAFIKNFTRTFLKKLTPVIRLLYTFAIVIFFLAWIGGSWNLAITAFIFVNFLLIFEIAEKLTVRDELEIARDVQTELITVNNVRDEDIEISTYYETAREVGGDFMDFIEKDNGSYLISIGDVSGKGMSAALQMVQVRLLFRFISDSLNEPKEIMTSLNKNIFKYINKGVYFTMTLAEVRDKVLKICRAGHTPLVYYSSKNNSCSLINQKGMAVGLCSNGLFESSLEEFTLKTETNDIIIFYSDGLTETMNSDRNEFGIEKLKELICENSGKTPEEIKNIILEEVSKFRGYAEVHDDITFIIMKIK